MWRPDRSGDKPIYQQIAEHIERRIAFGELPPGSALPSERKLAQQWEVNRSTVIQAYEELRASGLIESIPGSGRRVSRYKWGIAPKHTPPNWRQYAEGGTFMPNLPFIRRLREAKRSETPLIDFSSGELAADLFPNDAVRKLMKEQPFTDHLGYHDPQGYLPLRETLTAYLQRYHQIQATEASVFITSGSQQSLYLITQCLLSPGDAVAIEDPSYAYSLPMFQSAGLRLFRLPVDEGGARPEDVVALHRKHKLKMIFLNPNFQNPTGSVLLPARRKRMLELAAELGVPIVEDDPFSLTACGDMPLPLPLKSLDTDGTVLYIGSLSKIAASGFRIGWLIAPQEIVSRLTDARLQMDFGLSIFPQWIANAFLQSEHFPQHLHELRQALKARRDLLLESLRQLLPEEISCRRPEGGLNLWCKIRQPISDSRLLEEGIKRSILFVPGSVYGSESGYVRLSYSRPGLSDIPVGAARLAEAIRAARL
ncbi:HTH-type transcriptional regulator NorG [Paenibacillus konkukensis]|uniref:HTH-type transcriptional regulator NorG n=1 Tax=Paenibacillus konkukensis TaxID=2020716 RepID=A0ABY4RNX1_9BACL|nr:PLP-dependent aminotransferase family protein [Paenibacillus konkukensis]UQZ83665.1 HTH-type transcriptional regulator NorG [Paenibacillus konkukensis]